MNSRRIAGRIASLRWLVTGVLFLITLITGTGLAVAQQSGSVAQARKAPTTCEVTLSAGRAFRVDRSGSESVIEVDGPGTGSAKVFPIDRCAPLVRMESIESGKGVRVHLGVPLEGLKSIEQTGDSLRIVFFPGADTTERNSPASASGDYRIGLDDVLTITVANHDIVKEVQVDRDGKINFNYVGAVEVAGMTAVDAARKLQVLLDRDWLVDPQVSVTVKEFASQFVFVTGMVRKPGKVPLKGGTTLNDILAEAGGFDREAADEVVVTRHVSEGSVAETLHFTRAQIEQEGRSALDLRPGDEVHVPEKELIYIDGEVYQPGSYPYSTGITLRRALLLARGLKEWANKKDVKLLGVRNGKPVVEKYDLRDVERLKIPDVPLRPGDLIIVGRRLL